VSLLVIGRGWGEVEGLDDPTRTDTIREAQRQGFGEPVGLHWPGGGALWFPTPGNPRGSGACLQRGERFAAYIGTVHWRGLTGEALLDELLRRAEAPARLPLDEFSGAFVMLLGLDGEVWTFTDSLGVQKLYTVDEGRLSSSSMLLCRAALRHCRVDRLRAQEYVLTGGNHGLETPIEGLTLLDPTLATEWRSGRTLPLHPADSLRMACPFGRREDAVAAIAELISGQMADCVRALGPDIGMALSGGFDSRLLLAALQGLGVAPALYVYGRPEDEDVRVATAVAQGLSLPIQPFDKSRLDAAAPPLNAARLADNLAFFDGLPADGAFDLGADRQTRLLQMADGRLNLNGGGGEVLRNFFYLGNRRYRASELVSTFYANWRPQVFPRDEERRAFLAAMRDGILWSLGRLTGARADEPLPRSDVELVYPLFRLRFWMGRNNMVAARHGAFLTPLTDARLARLTAALPMGWKQHGRLEAEVITRLSPAVAAGPSAYGFPFTQGPGLGYRAKALTTLWRPPGLRRLSATVRQRLGLSHTAAMPERWREVAATLPPQDWVVREHLTDTDQLARLLSLQALVSPSHCGVHPIR